MKEEIHILYTNDLHSHFENWPKVATYMKQMRSEKEGPNSHIFTVDIGDHMDRVDPLTEASLGGANIQLLNHLQYDVVTLGNNEGITLAHESLYHLYDDADFRVVCSNLECVWSEKPNWLLSHHVEETKLGTKIGFIGLTARFNPYYHLLGWNVTEVFHTLQEQVKILQGKTDIIVLLSHVGIYIDEQIAQKFPEIDVIIGGHTHHLLENEEKINETLLTAAGKNCYYVGDVELVFDHQTNKMINKKAKAVSVKQMAKDLDTEQYLEQLEIEAKKVLNKPICTLREPITINWFKETNFMHKFTERLRLWTDADIAMLNAGLLIDSFPQGKVTYGDVHRICPHPINPLVVEVTGDELMQIVQNSLSKELISLKLRGFGFRGDVVGRIVFANLDVETFFDENGEEQIKKILYKGKYLQTNETFRLATGDMFSFGKLMPEIANKENKILYLPEFIRKILVHTLLEVA